MAAHVTINVFGEPTHDVLRVSDNATRELAGKPFIVLQLGDVRLILEGFGFDAARSARTMAQTLVLAATKCEQITEALPPVPTTEGVL